MAKTVIELRRDRAKLIEDQRAILDKAESEDRPLTAEERDTYSKLDTDADALKQRYTDIEDQERREAELGDIDQETTPPTGTQNRTADQELEERKVRTFCEGLATGNFTEYRALQQDSATQAGYLVAPTQMMSEIIKGLDNEMVIRQAARTFILKGAISLGAPHRTARASTFAMGTEIGAPDEDTTLAYGKRELVPHPASGLLKVSRPLLRNADNAASIVQDELAYDAAETQEEKFMTGSGANEPLGLFTASANGISTDRDVSTDNTTTAFTADGLQNAKFTLKKQYRRTGSWLFHRDGVKMAHKLKDGEGQYLLVPGIREGESDRLLGLPVLESEYAPNTFTTGLYVGMVGDFRNYWIVDSLNLEVQILNELYAANNQVGFIARIEFDGAPVLEEAFARVKLG